MSVDLTLASFSIACGADAKTLQELLRHGKVRRPLIIYSRALPAKGMMAQAAMLTAIFDHSMPAATNHGCEEKLPNRRMGLEGMVGTRRLELLTSTVSVAKPSLTRPRLIALRSE